MKPGNRIIGSVATCNIPESSPHIYRQWGCILKTDALVTDMDGPELIGETPTLADLWQDVGEHGQRTDHIMHHVSGQKPLLLLSNDSTHTLIRN